MIKSASEALTACRVGEEKPQSEDYDRLVIESAVMFTCSMKHAGAYWTERFPTLVEASAMTAVMERSDSTKRAIIYAVLPTGSTVMVPRVVWEDLLNRVRTFVNLGGSYTMAAKMKANLDLIKGKV